MLLLTGLCHGFKANTRTVGNNTCNVVPVLQLLAIDFSAQRPDWYVEPSVEAA